MDEPKPSLLIADDEPDMLDLLDHWLGDRYEIVKAANGDEALTLAHEGPPDLALVDIVMPRLSGAGLVWAMRHDRALESVPVAVMTSNRRAVPWLHEECTVLQKPFRKGELLTVLEGLVSGDRRPAPAETEPHAERRRTRRFEVDLGGVLTGAGQRIPGRVVSLSLLGAFLRTEEDVDAGSEWALAFSRDQEWYEVPAEVLYSMERGGGGGVGLQTHHLGLEKERQMQLLLEDLLRADLIPTP